MRKYHKWVLWHFEKECVSFVWEYLKYFLMKNIKKYCLLVRCFRYHWWNIYFLVSPLTRERRFQIFLSGISKKNSPWFDILVTRRKIFKYFSLEYLKTIPHGFPLCLLLIALYPPGRRIMETRVTDDRDDGKILHVGY